MKFKKNKNSEENNQTNEQPKIISTKYRELAEYVLQRFKVKKTEEKTDYEIIMEFSKMSDPNAKFDFNVNYPSGNLNNCRPTSKVDGIIWANKYAPEFVKTVISDEEWLDIWKRERRKKTSNSESLNEAFTADSIISKAMRRDTEYQETFVKNNDLFYKINLNKILNIIQEEYQKELEQTSGIIVPDVFTILNFFAELNFFNDFADMAVKAEQEITNNFKNTYIEYTQQESYSINEIINEYEENDTEGDIFNDDDDDEFDDMTDDLFDDNN